MSFQPGTLVKVRNRDWVVLPSDDKNILLIRPLDGTEEETTGIFLPLNFSEDQPHQSEFPLPTEDDLGSFSTASLLFNSARLSFRNVSGPFRSFGKLSFRLKSYQIVPLVMALKQDIIRLLIADDVGVGKTIEALAIVKELIERGELKRFAVVCLPHLCDQWQQELKDKFSIDAVIVRSSTAAQLDRKLKDESIFKAYPYQVISIDFIKSERNRYKFLNDCPELVIVDEAHTCARPEGASTKQQQRHYLVKEISQRDNQHLILLTATPHSGKSSEFQSLLGLLKPEYEMIDITGADRDKRAQVARNLVIRRRADVEQWYETTTFPERENKELSYELSSSYKKVFNDLLKFVKEIDQSKQIEGQKKKFRYFAILSLLRGVMSSPAAGMEMLARKSKQLEEVAEDESIVENPVADSDEGDSDATPANVLEKAELSKTEQQFLKDISEQLTKAKDNKVENALIQVKQWLREGYNPIVFCRFIATAKYVGEYFSDKLTKDTELLVITGEMVDELRKEKINELSKSNKKKVLIATDCLSEGINLQEQFTAVLHYDLPWNPNRLEQREGRIDRFGQSAEKVKAYLLYGRDNPIDSVVLKVLLRKAREIRKQTGISVPFPEDSQGILDSLINSVILNPNAVNYEDQLELDLEAREIESKALQVTDAYERAAERDKKTHSIFAQHSIKVNEIEEDLKQVDNAIGDSSTVKEFVMRAMGELGAQVVPVGKGYLLYTTNLNSIFKSFFDFKDQVRISFESPTPQGFQYIGRNHPFVEYLCQHLLSNAISRSEEKIVARASVITTDKVEMKTTIMELRVRLIIADSVRKNELIAEEMLLFGYAGSPNENNFIKFDECNKLIKEAVPLEDLSIERQKVTLRNELDNIKKLDSHLRDLVKERSTQLIEAHERYRKLLKGKQYNVVEPVLPPDILGVYILLPKI